MPAPVHIALSVAEFRLACQVGMERQLNAALKDRQHHNGTNDICGWSQHIEGAVAEACVAKYLGQWWSGTIGQVDAAADVLGLPYHIEVRSTAHPRGRLILHDKDPDKSIFILATGTAPAFTLRGWMWAQTGKTQANWCDPSKRGRPAYFVPQSNLRAMEELKEKLNFINYKVA